MAKSSKQKEYEQLGKMVSEIYESGYLDKSKMLKTSFLKGLVSGFGGVVGATVVVALLLWILSLFSAVPFTDNVKEVIEGTRR